jgi:hypothetical protein
MHQFEILRLCAPWDSVDPDKENIPTIIELIDHPDVIEALARETSEHWTSMGASIIHPNTDPAMRSAAQEALERANREFGEQQADKGRAELREAIAKARGLLASPKLTSIMNLRHKRLAHSLSQTREEKKSGPIAPMKYGDERELLNASIQIVASLYCWVNGCSFDFEDSRKIDREHAHALWMNCKFNIERVSR